MLTAFLRSLLAGSAICTTSVCCADASSYHKLWSGMETNDFGIKTNHVVIGQRTPFRLIDISIIDARDNAGHRGRVTLLCSTNTQNFVGFGSRQISQGKREFTIELDTVQRKYSYNLSSDGWQNMYSANDEEFMLANSDRRATSLDRRTGAYSDHISTGQGDTLQQTGTCKPGKPDDRHLF